MAKRAVAAIADPMDVVVFSSLVACLEGGKFDEDLTQAMRAMVSRLRQIHHTGGGKPVGKVNLQIGFHWEDGTIRTTQSFSVDPSVTRSPDRFFVSPDGALTQRPPQEAIPLKGIAR